MFACRRRSRVVCITIPFERWKLDGIANFQLAYKLGEEDKQRLINGSKAHTISQRLRTLKKIPPELIPLGMIPLVSQDSNRY
jgi:hypothetical protein